MAVEDETIQQFLKEEERRQRVECHSPGRGLELMRACETEREM